MAGAPVVKILVETQRTKVTCFCQVSASKFGLGSFRKPSILLSKHQITTLLCEDLQVYHIILPMLSSGFVEKCDYLHSRIERFSCPVLGIQRRN